MGKKKKKKKNIYIYIYQYYYHRWVEVDFGSKMVPWTSSDDCIEKTNEEIDPDVPTHEQKELSKCDDVVNYPAYRTSLGDFQV